MKKVFLGAILVLTVGCTKDRPYLQTLQLNREASNALKEQKFSEAQDSLLKALQFDPFTSALHLNLGLSFEGLQLAEKAQQAYKEAGRLADQSLQKEAQFLSRYNEAQLLGKAKKIDEALLRYQAALEINPESIEAKHNIELLLASQQGGGQGEGEQKDQQQGGDQSQQSKDQKGDESKDQKDQKDSKDGDKEEEEKPQEKQSSAKYVPRKFDGKELSEGDVKKILGELKQQESRIRSEYNKKEGKELAS